jgi:hypothetical protein
MALSARREVIQPGSPLYDYILAGNPRLLKAASYLQNGLFYFLFIAHGIETPLFAWTRLRKHNVSVLSLTWLKWMLSVFVGEFRRAGAWVSIADTRNRREVRF